MSDAPEKREARLECEEPLRVIKGGLAALALIEDDRSDHLVTKALSFIIAPMEEAVERMEKVLDLAGKKGRDNG